MRVDIFTALPGILEAPLSASLLGRARERGLVDVRVHDLRDHTDDRHRSVDDSPFGGGAVLKTAGHGGGKCAGPLPLRQGLSSPRHPTKNVG